MAAATTLIAVVALAYGALGATLGAPLDVGSVVRVPAELAQSAPIPFDGSDGASGVPDADDRRGVRGLSGTSVSGRPAVEVPAAATLEGGPAELAAIVPPAAGGALGRADRLGGSGTEAGGNPTPLGGAGSSQYPSSP